MENAAELKLPIGVTDFAQIRTGGYYYVDKTQFIEDYVYHRAHSDLITRPICFGKTLTLSMLRSFFEIGTDKSLFDGLYISKNKELCDEYMGKYPVVSISFKDAHAEDYETARMQIEDVVIQEADRFKTLFENDEVDSHIKQIYAGALCRKKSDIQMEYALAYLIMALSRIYNQKVILLVDDWDAPLIAATKYGYYDQMASLIRYMVEIASEWRYGNAIAVLMGCLHIPIGGGYFDSYNYRYSSVLDAFLCNAVGFTKSEAKAMLDYYGLEGRMEELEHYCGGYTISKENMFSPQCVFEFISEKIRNQSAKAQYQKIRERECDMINSLLQNKEYFDMRAQRSLNKILEGQKQQADITPYVKYKEENQLLANPMWSILFLWGYLGRKRCGDFNFCNYWIVNERSKALLRECFDVCKEEQENEP